ncbi:MAG TPA: hypothetical protein VHB79_23760 [Polyangiaceae bacterium]|nr:hypothetical protein [Polyangiaceae bacterium]
MSVWAPLLGVVGWHFSGNDVLHRVLLGASITISLGLGGVRAYRRRAWFPLVLTAAGCALIVAAELAGDYWPATLLGTALLLTSFQVERRGSRVLRTVGVSP